LNGFSSRSVKLRQRFRILFRSTDPTRRRRFRKKGLHVLQRALHISFIRRIRIWSLSARFRSQLTTLQNLATRCPPIRGRSHRHARSWGLLKTRSCLPWSPAASNAKVGGLPLRHFANCEQITQREVCIFSYAAPERNPIAIKLLMAQTQT